MSPSSRHGDLTVFDRGSADETGSDPSNPYAASPSGDQ
jgi:hypothetical protein